MIDTINVYLFQPSSALYHISYHVPMCEHTNMQLQSHTLIIMNIYNNMKLDHTPQTTKWNLKKFTFATLYFRNCKCTYKVLNRVPRCQNTSDETLSVSHLSRGGVPSTTVSTHGHFRIFIDGGVLLKQC